MNLVTLGTKISVIAALLVNMPTVSVAATYHNFDSSLQVNNPTKICRFKPITYRLQRYGQIFQGTIYPSLTLIPCSRYEPVAYFGGKFRAYKVTGDRREACTGKVAIRLNDYGREVDITLMNTGSLPGNYCRDRKKVLRYRLYRY